MIGHLLELGCGAAIACDEELFITSIFALYLSLSQKQTKHNVETWIESTAELECPVKLLLTAQESYPLGNLNHREFNHVPSSLLTRKKHNRGQQHFGVLLNTHVQRNTTDVALLSGTVPSELGLLSLLQVL